MKFNELRKSIEKLRRLKERESGQELFGEGEVFYEKLAGYPIKELESLKKITRCPEGVDFLDSIIGYKREWARGMHKIRVDKGLANGGRNNLSEVTKLEDDKISQSFHYLEQMGYGDDEYVEERYI